MEKRCTACGRSLPLAEFYRKVDGADGLMARCKACHKAAVQRHHEDYARPLEVAWLCRPCHLALHGRLGDGY